MELKNMSIDDLLKKMEQAIRNNWDDIYLLVREEIYMRVEE